MLAHWKHQGGDAQPLCPVDAPRTHQPPEIRHDTCRKRSEPTTATNHCYPQPTASRRTTASPTNRAPTTRRSEAPRYEDAANEPPNDHRASPGHANVPTHYVTIFMCLMWTSGLRTFDDPLPPIPICPQAVHRFGQRRIRKPGRTRASQWLFAHSLPQMVLCAAVGWSPTASPSRTAKDRPMDWYPDADETVRPHLDQFRQRLRRTRRRNVLVPRPCPQRHPGGTGGVACRPGIYAAFPGRPGGGPCPRWRVSLWTWWRPNTACWCWPQQGHRDHPGRDSLAGIARCRAGAQRREFGASKGDVKIAFTDGSWIRLDTWSSGRATKLVHALR